VRKRIGRREFISLLGGAAAWPLAARAQQPAMPVIGFISPGSPEPLRQQLAAFRAGLASEGLTDGQNASVQYRFAEGQLDRLPSIVSDLVRLQVKLLVVTSLPGAVAVKQAKSSIPTVFSVGGDPIEFGLVPSYNQPGGNLTGVYQLATGLRPRDSGSCMKWLRRNAQSAHSSTRPIRPPTIRCVICRRPRVS
jgi:putative tryptophan/tyrosine transport system substrate-binding protein